MENRKLVKEIITTETEKFTEEGNIKERVKETKERIFSEDFSKEELNKAEEVKPVVKEVQEPEKTQDELIKEVAEKIDKENKKPVEEKPTTPSNPYEAYLQSQTQQPTTPNKFPWEK